MHVLPSSAEPGLPDPLNEHELEVLRLAAVGLSNRQVGDEMHLAVNTVQWHLKHAYEKLDVNGQVTAVTRAQDLGLLWHRFLGPYPSYPKNWQLFAPKRA